MVGNAVESHVRKHNTIYKLHKSDVQIKCRVFFSLLTASGIALTRNKQRAILVTWLVLDPFHYQDWDVIREHFAKCHVARWQAGDIKCLFISVLKSLCSSVIHCVLSYGPHRPTSLAMKRQIKTTTGFKISISKNLHSPLFWPCESCAQNL